MTWVKLDENMVDHPKVAQLSDRAFRLHICGISYSNRHLTDGSIPIQIAHKLVTPRAAHYAAELVTAGVWEQKDPTTYFVHDYGDYQPSKAEVLELRQKRADAGRIGGKRSKPRSKREANALASAEAKQEAKPKPVQSQSQSSTLEPQDQSTLSSDSARAHDLTVQISINAKDVQGETKRAAEYLLAALSDRDEGTAGRLVAFARAGATPADFHDARQGITTSTTSGSPSKKACQIIEQNIRRRQITGAA